jgi:branched-subunit amino acid aminotransferase/4-amino-4-deoxychorismate lyase
MLAWRNGDYVDVPDGAEVATVQPGPCLFETFALRGGRAECLSDHLARLAMACPRLGLDPRLLHLGAAAEPQAWGPILRKLLAKAGLTDAIVRLIVAARPDGSATEWLTVRALPVSPSAIDLFELRMRRDAPEWLPRPKSGPWRNSSDAWKELRAQADRPDAEGVQCDARGCVSEGPRSSLAWWDGERWCFPSVSTGRLPGTASAQFRGVVALAGRTCADVDTPFPMDARSVVVLRSTFQGGGVLARSYRGLASAQVWAPAQDQSEAQARLADLAGWRAQRSVSLA